MAWNGTVRCSSCYKTGHNRRGCPSLKQYVKDNPDSYEARLSARKAEERKANPRRCSYCKVPGHTRRTCTTINEDRITLAEKLTATRAKLTEKLIEVGLGIGALVECSDGYYDRNLKPALVTDASWSIADDADGLHTTLVFLENGRERRKTFQFDSADGYGGYKFNVLSPMGEDAIRASLPKRWVNGTWYNEDEYFPKGESRKYWKFDGEY